LSLPIVTLKSADYNYNIGNIPIIRGLGQDEPHAAGEGDEEKEIELVAGSESAEEDDHEALGEDLAGPDLVSTDNVSTNRRSLLIQAIDRMMSITTIIGYHQSVWFTRSVSSSMLHRSGWKHSSRLGRTEIRIWQLVLYL
jgi:hypothetical protein